MIYHSLWQLIALAMASTLRYVCSWQQTWHMWYSMHV